MSNEASRLKKSEHVTWKALGEGGSMLLDLDSGQYFSLNETATAVWELVIAGWPTRDIVQQIAKGFDVDAEVVQTDVQELILSLREGGLVTEAGEATAQPEVAPVTATPSGPYTRPTLEEHELVKQVTTGSWPGDTHYWWPS